MSFEVIKPEQLAQLWRQGERVDLIDVRTPVEFREVHVAHARNVPLDKLDPATVMRARNGAANELLYIVCQSGRSGSAGLRTLLEGRIFECGEY